MSDSRNGIIVNHLPAPTWNRLGVNRTFVDFDQLPQVEASATYSISGSEQVNLNIKTMPTKEAMEWADSFTGGIRREATIAGKRAIYQEQEFATGLGGNYTEFIDNLVPSTDIYTVESGECLGQPVILSWNFGHEGKAAAQQIIHAKKNSKSTFLFVYESDKEVTGHAAYETKVILEEGAQVDVIKVNLLGENFVLLDDTAAALADDATFAFTQMELGGSKVYTGCHADQYGDNWNFIVNTGYMADQDHVIDINYVTTQRGRNTDSKIYVKGSLKDTAYKIFRGTIDFRQGAKGSTGDEQEDVLILDPGVVNKTVPVILSEEEQVEGRHGATIGNLAQDMLFYLGTRGIDKEAAEMLTTRGRLLSIAHTIPDEDTVSKISTFIREAFEVNE